MIQNMGKLDGKIALVGGNIGKIKKGKYKMGLGGAIAKYLMDEGAQVIIVDHNFEVSKNCAQNIGGNIKAMECDLMKDRSYDTEGYVDHRGNEKTKVIWKENPALHLVEEIAQEFGKLDILVTNFDQFGKARLDSTTDDMYIKMREENITPSFLLFIAPI